MPNENSVRDKNFGFLEIETLILMLELVQNALKIKFFSPWGTFVTSLYPHNEVFYTVFVEQKWERKSTSKLCNLRPKRGKFGLNLRPRVFDFWPRCELHLSDSSCSASVTVSQYSVASGTLPLWVDWRVVICHFSDVVEALRRNHNVKIFSLSTKQSLSREDNARVVRSTCDSRESAVVRYWLVFVRAVLRLVLLCSTHHSTFQL